MITCLQGEPSITTRLSPNWAWRKGSTRWKKDDRTRACVAARTPRPRKYSRISARQSSLTSHSSLTGAGAKSSPGQSRWLSRLESVSWAQGSFWEIDPFTAVNRIKFPLMSDSEVPTFRLAIMIVSVPLAGGIDGVGNVGQAEHVAGIDRLEKRTGPVGVGDREIRVGEGNPKVERI